MWGRNSLSLVSTSGIDIYSPVPPADLYHAVHRGIHSAIAPPRQAQRREDFVSGQNSASRLDRVLGPRRPVLRRAIAGIASDRISVTGTGVRRIGRRAPVSTGAEGRAELRGCYFSRSERAAVQAELAGAIAEQHELGPDRGIRFARDSPLEGDGFEPSVPGLGGGWPAPIPSRA